MNPGEKLRIVALCCDGTPQRHFLRRLAELHQLVGVVIHATPPSRNRISERVQRYRNPVLLARHLRARWLARSLGARVAELERRLFWDRDGPPALPIGPRILRTADVNSPEVVAMIAASGADLVCVNGTNLLRAPVLDLAGGIRCGFVNLHTGLSPYTRGGNCNLWALLENHPEWIGVTVHHIDPGIDSGDIILSAQTPLEADDLYEWIQLRNFRQGFDLFLEAIGLFESGSAPRVPQWEEGRLYLRRTGFVYEPWLHVRANRMIREGVIRRYLEARTVIDAQVRTVTPGR
ncbi:MAG: formyl transferase [Thermoanaerobaculia bacterium]